MATNASIEFLKSIRYYKEKLKLIIYSLRFAQSFFFLGGNMAFGAFKFMRRLSNRLFVFFTFFLPHKLSSVSNLVTRV